MGETVNSDRLLVLVGRLILSFLALVALFLFFYQPNPPVDDFWWHLATGRWIVENNSLPSIDPFLITSGQTTSLRQKMILHGYWLAQVSSFLLYKASGWQGLLLAKAALFTALCVTISRFLVYRGVGCAASYLLSLAILPIALSFLSLRPHIFSVLGAVLFFIWTEKGLDGLRSGRLELSRHLYWLPVLTMLWANLHSGFIIGQGMALIYILAEGIKLALGRNQLEKAIFKRFLGWQVLAIAAAFLNPNHLNVWLSIVLEGNPAGPFAQTIEEYLSVWKLASFTGNYTDLYLMLGVLLVSLTTLCISWKRVALSHWALFGIFSLAGFSASRFSIFFVAMAILIAAPCLAALWDKKRLVVDKIALGVMLAAIPCLIAFSWNKSVFAQGTLSKDLPDKAVTFFKEKRLPGPVFNPYEWGGYLVWNLFPQYQFFIDARTLDYSTYLAYQKGLNSNPAEVLGAHGIQTVIFYYSYKDFAPLSGMVFSLLVDGGWDLVYSDNLAVIFTRKTPLPSTTALSKVGFIDSFIGTILNSADFSPEHLHANLLLGQLHYAKKDAAGARRFFGKALSIDPQNGFARNWVALLDRRP